MKSYGLFSDAVPSNDALGNPSKTFWRILPVKGGGYPPLSAKLF